MNRRWTLLILILLLADSQSPAQSVATAQAVLVQVSTAQLWNDTGLDLQTGDVIKISAAPATSNSSDPGSGTPACNPDGTSEATKSADLPLPGANVGALIARLHAQGAPSFLVGASKEVHVSEPSRLYLGMNLSGIPPFLGMNASGTPPCQGGLAVRVQRTPALSASTAAATTEQKSADRKTRGQQLKSQLANAAQVFMAGQFGLDNSWSNTATDSAASGTSATTAAPATSLNATAISLDKDLRRGIDDLPRRVNDQFNHLGDMVNFVIIGSEKNVEAALDAAAWHVADTSTQGAVVNAILQTYGSKDYLAMPMSTLYLFGRKQDFGYEMAEPIAMVASRHHFRIWKASFTSNGNEVWVGAGTHDIGFAKDQRNNNVTHKIDPAVDGERDNIGLSLQKTDKAKTLTYYLPPNPVQEAKNATGDGYHSDGRLLIVFLK